jgi:hypothetical protein
MRAEVFFICVVHFSDVAQYMLQIQARRNDRGFLNAGLGQDLVKLSKNFAQFGSRAPATGDFSPRRIPIKTVSRFYLNI